MRLRGFEWVKGVRVVEGDIIRLPERSSKGSAGYDFFATADVTIPSMIWDTLGVVIKKCFKYYSGNTKVLDDEVPTIKPFIVWTNVKSYMQDDEVLELYNRSSNPKKLGLLLANSVGIIDKDYYSNSDNDGNIGFAFYNIFPFSVTIKKGEKIGQGIFKKYLVVDNDNADGERVGGFGSSGK